MSRVLKFRIWDKKKNKFVHENRDKDYLLDFEGNIVFPDTVGELHKRVDFCHLIIQQFTGLSDKNGVEIYEGDILENNLNHPDYKFGTIIFDEIYSLFGIKYDGLTRTVKTDKYECASRFEVVGNLFQNPELLEKI